MIPKIAHFHWDGRPMNWLRMVGVHTFTKLNPDWEVRIIRTPENIRKKDLPTHAHAGDWARLQALHDHGGFSLATDTVFIKPMPDEWCEAEMCGCTNGTGNLYHCCFGSAAGTEFLERCLEQCGKVPIAPSMDYQALGITLLNKVLSGMGGLRHMGQKFIDMPTKALTPISSAQTERFWDPDPFDLQDETIGVIWFGGSDSSKAHELEARERSADSAIVRLALEVT